MQRDWWWYCSDWTCQRYSFWPHWALNPRTSGSVVLHSTTMPGKLLVFISDNFRYLTLVQRHWWWYCSDWTCERFNFFTTPGVETQNLWISSPALYHCATATSHFHLWQYQVFNSGAEGLVVVLFWLDLWEILFLATLGFEPRTSRSLVLQLYHCPMATSGFHLWTICRYLTLVQRDWWWYCSDWTCQRFSFWPHRGLNPGHLDL